MTAVTAAWICLLSPLASVGLITLAGNRITRRQAGVISTLSTFVAFGAALVSFFALRTGEPEDRTHYSTAYSWLTAGRFDFGAQILVDPLSVFEMLVVAGIGALIIWYSIGYMDGSDEERRYFAYMSLFVFSMLLLVQGGNLLMLLAGWGMVGLSSYLLIGYDQHRPAAIAAAKKAFIMNAFGDATMALALFLLIQKTGVLQYDQVFEAAKGFDHDGWVINLVALGLLGGAVAKSAQIPLQTWLPDAMEGPTPVSALIHAATMVTAGVFLIVRVNPLFEAAPHIQDLAAGIGVATLLLAGLVALVQVDIKRVIAYSTMSQIGYMFLGAGLGAYASGMFHLMTHAFFKALLFLAAGIAIHALAGEQDIRKMRGIGALMPYTKWVFLVGTLALVGIPPFSGFFSKDPIIAAALARGDWYGYVLWVAALGGAFLTGIYAFRLYFLVFRGQPDDEVRAAYHSHHGKEGPSSMILPVGVLAIGSVVAGWIQFADRWDRVSGFLEPVARPILHPTGTEEAVTSVLAVGVGLAGIGVAWAIYVAGRVRVPEARFWRDLLEHKLYFDELYDLLFSKPADAIARTWYTTIERPLIAGSLDALGFSTRETAAGVSGIQTGFVRSYILAFAAALGVMAVVFVAVR
jgi:NADH-quinone oxidoreductase subunit L